jgi:hypothetical protein
MMTMNLKNMEWKNGTLILSGDWTADEFEEMMDAYTEMSARNKQIVKRAEALAKVVIEQEGVVPAIREVMKYINTHADYEKFGQAFGLREAKEIVDRLR